MNPRAFVRLLGLSVSLVVAGLSEEAAPPPGDVRVVEVKPLRWLADLVRAQELAKAENKRILLNFTGSDWCVWCHRLDAEVFSQEAFRDFAATDLILVVVDFPVKTPLSLLQKKQNAALAKQYSVSGYPTLVLTDASGKELGRTGYMQGGAKTFVRELKRLAK